MIFNPYYTGIGSRQTPPYILRIMEEVAADLALAGCILRSGAAPGADLAFERGCDRNQGRKEIYLPWKGFNHSTSPLYDIPEKAYMIASETIGHRWNALTMPVKKLMARNVMQVMGQNLDTPSAFVICWSSDGCNTYEKRSKQTGGTGQAIALASIMGIPIYNLQRKDDHDYIVDMYNIEL